MIPETTQNISNLTSASEGFIIAVIALFVSPFVTWVIAKHRENETNKRFIIEEKRRLANELRENLGKILVDLQELSTAQQNLKDFENAEDKVDQRLIIDTQNNLRNAIRRFIYNSTQVLLLLNNKNENEKKLLEEIDSVRNKIMRPEKDIQLEEIAKGLGQIAASAHNIFEEWRSKP